MSKNKSSKKFVRLKVKSAHSFKNNQFEREKESMYGVSHTQKGIMTIGKQEKKKLLAFRTWRYNEKLGKKLKNEEVRRRAGKVEAS